MNAKTTWITGITLGLIASGALAAEPPSPEIVTLYDRNCASCHAKDGSGDTRMGKRTGAKDYRDAKVQAEMKDEAAFKSIKDGLKEKGSVIMKPFADKATDDQIKALVAYMRTFKKTP